MHGLPRPYLAMSHSALASPGRSSCTRPHSKTTVVGPSVKTRLQCNHLKNPKCKCSNAAPQKRSQKLKHSGAGASSQRRVLSSSRALPRGETNGRKTYRATEESVSVCDATWRPNLDAASHHGATTTTESHKHRDGQGKVIKKKLRFEDQVTESERRQDRDQAADPGEDVRKGRDEGQSSPSRAAPSSPRTSPRSSPERSIPGTSRDYCRLCEEAGKGYPHDSYRKRRKDEVPPDATKDTAPLPSSDAAHVSSQEICFLCHQNTHHCRGCDDYCKICDRYLYVNGSPGHQVEDHKAERERQVPARQDSGGEVGRSASSGIPYRPRTTFVKDLKQRLETTYQKDELVVSGNGLFYLLCI